MNMITLTAGRSTLTLAPELGGAVFAWERGGHAMFRPALPDAVERGFVRGLASFPLVPWSNRIVHGRFTFAGTDHALPATFGGHAIHGVGWTTAWHVAARTERSATMTMTHTPDERWPFAFDAEQHFALAANVLTCRMSATNRHFAPAPFGLGAHPYFPRRPDATLQFAAAGVWHNTPDKIPIKHTAVPPEWDRREPQPFGLAELDNCFTGWRRLARLAYPDPGFAIDIAADPLFANLVVYDGAINDFIAVEPVSNVNDGINKLAAGVPSGLRVLQPGETMAGTMTFAVEDLPA